MSITSPSDNAAVGSPFTLTASATTCSSEAVTSMAFALDSDPLTRQSGTALTTQVTASSGSHTILVSAWSAAGTSCSSSITVNVTAPPAPSSPYVPANAVTVSAIQALNTWKENHDPAAGSTSSGSTALVASPSMSGEARQFDTSFTGSGGELYFATFGSDPAAHDFVYDAWVYLDSSASSIANLEMDMNQVVANGDTIIYGFQCDGYSGTWDYTENAGTPASPVDRWVHSAAHCNVRTWEQNVWHHVQISFSRDDTGNVTYHSVWLDGKESSLDATVPSAFSLRWGSVLLTNFQIDGLNSGSNTVYLDRLTISRW